MSSPPYLNVKASNEEFLATVLILRPNLLDFWFSDCVRVGVGFQLKLCDEAPVLVEEKLGEILQI